MTQSGEARRLRRAGLYGPFVLLAIGVAILAGWWFWRVAAVERGLDAQRNRGVLDWRGRQVHGFPFRIDVDFASFAWRDGSGWAVAVPQLRTEASVFAPGHWVGVIPEGVVVTRPSGGAVVVKARVLRASLADLARRPASVAVEGLGLTFAPAPGAAPFLIISAAEAHLHTRAGPDDQGALLLEIDKAQPRPGSWLGAVAAGGQASLTLDALWTHASAFSGPAWSAAARGWTDSGGRANVRRLHVEAGRVRLDAAGSDLTADADGRLKGALDATITQAPPALAALARAGVIAPDAARSAAAVAAASAAGGTSRLPLTFLAGQTALGPTALAASPKVY